MNEQRSSLRSRTYLKAQIDLNGLSSLACVVRDMNESGARISLSDGIALPESFRLHLTKPDRWVRAHVRWRRADNVGVQFEAEGAAFGGEVDPRDRMRELEGEVARLRRMLEDLRNDPSKIHQILDQAA